MRELPTLDLPTPDISQLDPLTTAIVAGAVALAAACFGGAKRIVSTWFELTDLRLRKRYANGIKSIALMYDIIEHAKRLPHVHRIVMFTGRDSGGIPAPPSPFTVSSFFGWSRGGAIDPSSFYNFDIRADLEYANMLIAMIRDGVSVQTTAKMPENSMLKSYYVSEGVVDSRIYYLTIDAASNELHYCSVANYERDFTPAEVHAINVVIERLRSLMVGKGVQ